MLREVMKRFDGEHNTPLKPGDVVDVSGWKNRTALESQGYIAPTDATKPTVDQVPKKAAKSPNKTSAAPKLPAKIKRSALASRPRVFR